ncbi:hypothetical protein GCM10009083_18740 [Halopseudomonas pertucinogena]|uniref:Uncharacterized protein n=1 Tax=Halopseudomonas pertucinogena TaxID=86175 RepID=A0ABQ2CTY3_9GAMM|nr:hypothetical protein GCM10009083_18740 [Halopseudomonas pertucinogena]
MVKELAGLPELAGRYVRMIGDGGDHSYQLAVAERHPYPQTDLQHLRARTRRRPVIE